MEVLNPSEENFSSSEPGEKPDVLQDWDITVETTYLKFDPEEFRSLEHGLNVHRAVATTMYALQQCGLLEDVSKEAVLERINNAYDYYEWLKYNHERDVNDYLRPNTENFMHAQRPGKRYPRRYQPIERFFGGQSVVSSRSLSDTTQKTLCA